jgi:hypothetical protein
MVWQARNSDNSPRTPSAYVKHDKDNTPIGDLNSENAYVRNDESNAPEVPQPTSSTATDDYGNQYKNWNADYVPHDVNNA